MGSVHLLLAILGGGSAVLGAALALLIGRRALQERAAALAQHRGARFRATLLPWLLAGGTVPESELAEWRGDAGALAEAAHLLALLRGAERARLLALVERLGLVAAPLARLHSPRITVRIAAIRAVAAIELAGVREALLRALRGDRSIEVRLEAALALIRQKVFPPLELVCGWLDDRAGLASPAHRIVLRAIAAARPAEILAAWHAGRHGRARLALTDALGSLSTTAALGALNIAVRDPSPQMRCEALRALRRTAHPQAATAIVAALKDSEWIVRVQAAAAAGALGLREAAPALEFLRSDSHWWVRYRADEALAALALEPEAAAA